MSPKGQRHGAAMWRNDLGPTTTEIGRSMRLVLAFLLTPGAAWADCPTSADVARGIAVTYDDGTVERFSSKGPNTVERVQGAWSTLLIHGLYFWSSWVEPAYIETEDGLVPLIIPDSGSHYSYDDRVEA